MEVTVAMLITGIVIVMTYTVYSIVVKSYHNYNDKHAKDAVLIQVDGLLQNDFRRAENIYADQNHLVLEKEGVKVDYQFEINYIVRSSIIADTFKVNVNNVVLSFESSAVMEMSDNANRKIIDEMQLNITYDYKNFPYHYRKQYSSADLIKATSNALN